MHPATQCDLHTRIAESQFTARIRSVHTCSINLSGKSKTEKAERLLLLQVSVHGLGTFAAMFLALIILWVCSLLMLSAWFYCIFRPVGRPFKSSTDQPGVSILISIRNGADMLIENLPTLIRQSYPTFELLIIDDHSEESEYEKLYTATLLLPNVKLLRSPAAPGKKMALSYGVQQARFPLILCTDADCAPASRAWISEMVAFKNHHQIVLGYSPYKAANTVLNRWIRFETIMTCIQYASWTRLGRPYMGVGRNMLYERALFLQDNPYEKQQSIPYGDDDLLVQHWSRRVQIGLCLSSDAFVETEAPESWSDWLHQKHRHLSAGHHYKTALWWQPGIFAVLLTAHWMLSIVLFICCFSWWYTLLFTLGIIVRGMVFSTWSSRLGEKKLPVWYPFFELGYALYFMLVGSYTVLHKKHTWN